MFTSSEDPEPPVAVGAYWFFAPLAILLAVPGLATFLAQAFGIAFQSPLAGLTEDHRALLVVPLDAVVAVAPGVFPPSWADGVRPWIGEFLAFSFAGGAYAACGLGAGFQRALGSFAGFVAAMLLMLVLGGTLLGAGVSIFFLIWAGNYAFGVFEREQNDRALVLPVFASLVVSVALLSANAFFGAAVLG